MSVSQIKQNKLHKDHREQVVNSSDKLHKDLHEQVFNSSDSHRSMRDNCSFQIWQSNKRVSKIMNI